MQQQPSTTALLTDQFELPLELTAKPSALVGISGLDTINNAVHKSIWETFSSNRRIERAPIVFKLISNAHEFPVVKPKRNSYEWYIPKGILKRNWMNKHLNEIPAVITIFYELDWSDSLWNEKMIECASRVQSMRAALEGRNTRIVVVLIQDTPPLPAGEDVLASERAVALCASCELHAKSLFVLPHGDHLQGYVVRLENAFYDLAQSYYHLEAKNIKAHREHLNKTNHQYLFVRHQFKMGFLNELKQDNHTAHKHYTHAYNNLLEIRVVDTNAMEIRTVAGFINYKLCRLMFNLSLPRDAISQFKAHTERFKLRIGFQELAFEHHAWVSKQHGVFGDIFDEAVKLGLPAVQTQHPGVYYQQAAQHAILRKNSCRELCQNASVYPTPDPLENLRHLEFYGQRPWRPGKLSADPPDPQLESKGIQALQFLERQVNHSNIIISLYGFAISQYKTYRCLRMRRHLVVQMALEYINSQDYGKALTLLTHMLMDYRAERWWVLLTDILRKALQCAYLTASIQDFAVISLELLNTSSSTSLAVQKAVFENFNRILKKEIPQLQADVPEGCIENAKTLWKGVYTNKSVSLLLDMSNTLACIDTKARFLQEKYQGDHYVVVEVFVRNASSFAITFKKVVVTINSPGCSLQYPVNQNKSDRKDLYFNPSEVRSFQIKFMPDPNDVGKEIQIGAVNLLISATDDCVLDLKYSGLGNDPKSCPDLVHFKRSKQNECNYDMLKAQLTTLIVPRHSLLNVKFEHLQPALLGEWYEVIIKISNEEKYNVENLLIEISLGDDNIDQSTEFCSNESGKPENLPLKYQLRDLIPADKMSKKFYMRCYKVGPRNVGIKITYLLKSEKPVVSIKEETIPIPIVKPFDISTNFLSMHFGNISKFYVGEPFIITNSINCLSPWPISIEDTSLEFSSSVKLVDEETSSQIAGFTLQNGDTGTDIYVAEVHKQTDSLINIGQYTIKWKRKNGRTTTSQMAVTGLSVDWIPLDIKLPLPAFGLVRTPLLVSYKLYNRSQQLIQLEMNMEASEAFMFAGYKQMQVSILPESTKMLRYNLYPLVAGNVSLPKLTLTVPEGSTEGPSLRQDQLNSLIERTLPTHIFIMPQSKGMPDCSERLNELSDLVVK